MSHVRYIVIVSLFILFWSEGLNVIYGADNGVWVNSMGGDWTTNDPVNWTASPGSHPDGIDGIAGFIGFPNAMGTQTITSTATDITITSLHIDTLFPIKIDFSINDHKLIFSDTLGVSEITFGNSSQIVQGSGPPGTGTRIRLDSDLDIFVEESSQPLISGSISGSGALSLYASNNLASTNILTLAGSNSYTGGTNVYTGVLDLGGTDNNTVIPHALSGYSLSVFKGAQVRHLKDNLYDSTVSTLIDGGSLNLLGKHQIMTQLTMKNGGSLEDSAGGGNLELLQTSPGFALIMGSNSTLGEASAYNITLHGGGIQYDNSSPGPAFFAEAATIDLGGTVEFNVPHNRYNCFDVDIGSSIFQNTTLNKTGDGAVLFQGGQVPNFNIQEGTVIIGDQPPAVETIIATGLVTVSPGAVLGGFQTLDARGGLINNGTILPGSGCPCNTSGTLTINGNYTQTSSGSLEIKVLNATNADLLVVQNGAVTLDGILSLDTLPGGVLHVGDKILVLDNTSGSNPPISGKISSLISNLSPQLTASILQDPNQLFVLIGPCSPSSPPSLMNYINLSIPLITLTNAHNLQQRKQMTNIRERLPCLRCQPVLSISSKKTKKPQETSYIKENCKPLTIYGGYLGSTGEMDRISKQPGYDFDSAGGVLGANYAFYRGGVGGEIGYEHIDAHVHDRWGNFEIDSLFYSLYATFLPILNRHLFFDVAVESRVNWYDIHRHVEGQKAQGKPHSWQWDAFLDIGYDIFHKRWRCTPLASVEYLHLNIEDYSEHDAEEQNVHVGHQNFNSLRSWLGASIERKFVKGSTSWLPEIRGYWIHEFGSQHHSVKISSRTFNTNSRVQVFGGNRNFGTLGGALRALFTKWFIEGSYDYYWSEDVSSHLFYAELGSNF